MAQDVPGFKTRRVSKKDKKLLKEIDILITVMDFQGNDYVTRLCSCAKSVPRAVPFIDSSDYNPDVDDLEDAGDGDDDDDDDGDGNQ